MDDVWVKDKRILERNFRLQDFKCCSSCKNCSYDMGGGVECSILDRQHVTPLGVCDKYIQTPYEYKIITG